MIICWSEKFTAGDAAAKATEKAGDDKSKTAAEAEAAPKPVVKPRRDRKVITLTIIIIIKTYT